MQGLTSLTALAQREQALVAINGGFFNRVRRLPLGALKAEGRWLSGPILNRGAMGWQPGQMPRFGRLALQEVLVDAEGRRWPLVSVNSGYVQRGLARYTADWGRGYQALSGNESGVLLSRGVVRQQLDSAQLQRGIPLGPEDTLLVGRGGVVPPWPEASRLSLASQPSDPLGQQAFVMGGGPLLLLNGRVVLNAGAEGFGSAFQSQGAPRTVIGSDGRQLWLLTLQGVDHAGPTLGETAAVLSQLGLRDALNLDGGSSTGLFVGNTQTVRGRGVAASIHNGLGLVPRSDPTGQASGPRGEALRSQSLSD
jgi:exopolysaccharide biosynthesis protein